MTSGLLEIPTPRAFVPLLAPARYKGAWGGRGCLHPDTPIDTPLGQVKVSEFKGGPVYAWDNGRIVIAAATPASPFTQEQLYKVTLKDGRSISVTDQHRFLTQRGWVQCADLSMSDGVYCAPLLELPGRHQTNLGIGQQAFPASDLRLKQKLGGCRNGYSEYLGQYDQQPLSASSTGQAFAPSPADALRHSGRALMRAGALAFANTNTPSLPSRRLSSRAGLRAAVGRSFQALGSCIAGKSFELPWGKHAKQPLSHASTCLETPFEQWTGLAQDVGILSSPAQSLGTVGRRLRSVFLDGSFGFLGSCIHDLPILIGVESVCTHDRLVYWDFHVPILENYLSTGIVNHNSGKSNVFAELLVERCLLKPGTRWVCVREYQASLVHSVKRLIEDKIASFGVSHLFRILNTHIETPGDGVIIFVGMQSHNADSIKSLESFDGAWVEEAHSLSQYSLDLLRPTIRKEGSELWFSWNPEQQSDPIDQLLRGPSPPKDAVVIGVSYRDNPFFPDVLRDEMEADKLRDIDRYQWVWLGQYRTTMDGAVFATEIREAQQNGRITKVPYDPAKPVQTLWDLGWSDSTAIWFAQRVGLEWRMLEYMEVRQTTLAKIVAELQRKPYVYDLDWLPHDASSKTLASDGKSVEQNLQTLGRKTRVIPRVPQKQGAIDAARTIFASCYFDDAKCADGLNCLRRYRYDVDAKSGETSRQPLHDAASHGADAFMQLGLGVQETRKPRERPREYGSQGSWMG